MAISSFLILFSPYFYLSLQPSLKKMFEPEIFEDYAKIRRNHEKLFLPLAMKNNLTGLDEDCNPFKQRVDKDNNIVHFALGVLSRPDQAGKKRREEWRRSILLWPEEIKAIVKIRFFLALTEDEKMIQEIENEMETKKDVIVLGHVDSYYNITLKSIGVFTWAAEFCGAFYSIKTDDDVYVNIPALVKRFHNMAPVNIYAGHSLHYEPIRNPSSKTYMPTKEFPFPAGLKYMTGALVVLSWDLAYHVASVRHIPNFHWFRFEDLTTGYIIGRSGTNFIELDISLFFHTCRDKSLAVHTPSLKKQALLHDNLLNHRPLCQNYGAK